MTRFGRPPLPNLSEVTNHRVAGRCHRQVMRNEAVLAPAASHDGRATPTTPFSGRECSIVSKRFNGYVPPADHLESTRVRIHYPVQPTDTLRDRSRWIQ